MTFVQIDLNILRSEAFLSSEPVARATWLCLLAYCADQENGGRITNCKDWSERKWLQVVNVTKREAMAESTLWQWVDDDLLVEFYPLEKEEKVKSKRESARNAARIKWQMQNESARNANADANASADAVRNAMQIRVDKSRVDKSREGDRARAREDSPSQAAQNRKSSIPRTPEEAREWAALAGVPPDFAEQEWHGLNRTDWLDARGRRVTNFRSHLPWAYSFARSRDAEKKSGKNGSHMSEGAKMMARRERLKLLEESIEEHPGNTSSVNYTGERTKAQVKEFSELCQQAKELRQELATIKE